MLGLNTRSAALAFPRSAGAAPPSFDYTITNDAQWGTIPAGVLSGGGLVGVAPGNYTGKTISHTPSARLTFQATDPLNKPIIDKLTIGTCSNITFKDLDLRCSTWANADATAAACLVTGTGTNLIWDGCNFQGNYRGSYTDIDVVNALPEYACIAADVTAGAISALEITQPYVGDLLADGTYSLDFTPAGGTGASASFTVTGGNIVSTGSLVGGSGYGVSQHRTRRAIWTGQRRMLDWLPWGVRANGGTLVSPEFRNCTFKNVANALKPSIITGGITVTGCDFSRVYMDYMSFGLNHPTVPFPITITFNTGSLPFSIAGKDAGDPHSDWIQVFADDIGGAGNTTAVDWDNVLIAGNIFQDGTCRGGIQGMIIADMPTGISFAGWKVVGNHIASKSLTLGITIVNVKDAYIFGNNVIRHDHTDSVNNLSAVVLRIPGIQDDPGGGYYAYGRSFLGSNIVEGLETNSWGLPEVNITRYPNTLLGSLGATIAYTTAFSAPTASRSTVAQITSAYTPIGGAAGRGAFGVTSVVNHSAKTYTPANEPSYIGFNDLLGQTLGATITSEWSRVLGGTNGRSISITGGEFRIASDSIGTGATSWGSTSSTVNPGQWVQVRQTASGSNGTTTTVTLTIGGEAFSWNVTTIATPFVAVDNGATARSNLTSIPNEAGIRKLVVAFRAKPDTLVAGANMLADASASNFRAWTPTTTAYRGQFFGSTRCNLRPALTATTTAKTHIITLDLTNTNASQGCYWATLEDGILLNNTPGTGGAFDTRTTAGSGTDYGSFSPSTTGATGLFGAGAALGVFGESDGGGTLFDGQFEFLWIDWGGSSYTIPDITQSSVRSKWTSDQIGANGSGPTGSQPKLYFTGNASAWNANISNLGSLTITLTKQAGTYT